MAAVTGRSLRRPSAYGRALVAALAVAVTWLAVPDAAAQHRLSIHQFGTRAADYVRGATSDAAGNSYVVGSTYGAFAGNRSSGCSDAFVAKITRAGVLSWVRQFGTARQDLALAVATDDRGNVYVGGTLAGATSTGCNGEPADGYLRAYDANGTERWSITFASGDHDYVDGVVVFDDAVFVAATRAPDRLIARYTTDGALQWETVLHTGFGEGQGMPSLAVDHAGVYTAGTHQTTTDAADAITRKHDIADGRLVWETRWGTASGRDNTWAVAVAGSAVYVTGYRQPSPNSGALYFGPPFVARVEAATGRFEWQRELARSDGVARAVATDEAGNAYVAGLVMTTTRRGTTPDAFLWKVSPEGSTAWLNRSTLSTSAGDDAWGVSVNGTEVTVAGETAGSFCKGCSAGGRDAFVATFGTD